MNVAEYCSMNSDLMKKLLLKARATKRIRRLLFLSALYGKLSSIQKKYRYKDW